MSAPEAWIRALEQADRPTRFALDFSRLGLTAECRSLTAGEIGNALRLSGEEAARQLLYLSCPSLQQAGQHMTDTGALSRAEDITRLLPYSDVLQAASLILGRSGGGAGMVHIPSESKGSTSPAHDADAPARATEGYDLLRQWAAEDRLAAGGQPAAARDALSDTRMLQQTWADSFPRPTRQTDPHRQDPTELAPPADADAAAEQAARILCRRLMDAAGNM